MTSNTMLQDKSCSYNGRLIGIINDLSTGTTGTPNSVFKNMPLFDAECQKQ